MRSIALLDATSKDDKMTGLACTIATLNVCSALAAAWAAVFWYRSATVALPEQQNTVLIGGHPADAGLNKAVREATKLNMMGAIGACIAAAMQAATALLEALL